MVCIWFLRWYFAGSFITFILFLAFKPPFSASNECSNEYPCICPPLSLVYRNYSMRSTEAWGSWVIRYTHKHHFSYILHNCSPEWLHQHTFHQYYIRVLMSPDPHQYCPFLLLWGYKIIFHCYFSLHIPYFLVWANFHIVWLSFYAWLRIILSRFIQVVANGKISFFFYGWVIYHYI